MPGSELKTVGYYGCFWFLILDKALIDGHTSFCESMHKLDCYLPCDRITATDSCRMDQIKAAQKIEHGFRRGLLWLSMPWN
jgi:hypothetical protein